MVKICKVVGVHWTFWYQSRLTTKLGPIDSRWQFMISRMQSSVVMWSSVASSLTPHLMSTTWKHHMPWVHVMRLWSFQRRLKRSLVRQGRYKNNKFNFYRLARAETCNQACYHKLNSVHCTPWRCQTWKSKGCLMNAYLKMVPMELMDVKSKSAINGEKPNS